MLTACPDETNPGDDEIGDSGTGATEESGDGDGDTNTEETGTSSGESETAETETETETETTESTTEEESTSETESTTEEESTSETDTGSDNPLDDIPPEEWEPIPNPDGVPAPLPGVYDDLGEADPNAGFRSLIGLYMTDRQGLVDFVEEVGDPSSDIFGQYMTVDELIDAHAPSEYDFELLHAWLEFEGFSVNYLATNRMLIQFTGTVAQFNEAFDTILHVCMRKNPQQGNPPIPVYCTPDPMTLPIFVADRSPGIVTADQLAEEGPPPEEGGQI
ncbi:MAG: peptidase S53, partial [Deltaproteobacteria bacterium]|nr:peptidase S53 [Deltaproteobacteria bacterium]